MISLVVTWPLVIKFNSGVPFGGDAFQFIWNGWWFTKAMGDPSLSVWWTPYQYSQVGASLAIHDLSPLNAFLQMLLVPLVGEFGAFNLLTIVHYILGAWGAYILAFYLTGNRPASVTCGVIYGFSVFHAMHMPQLSTSSSEWLPLSVYYALKFIRDAGWRDGLLGILCILAAALSGWYHLVYSALLVFGFMLIGQSGVKDSVGGVKRWTRGLLIFAVPVLVVSPLLINAWLAAEALGVGERIELGKKYFFDPAWAVLPPPGNPVIGFLSRPFVATVPGNQTEGITSFGIIACVLGLLAWFRRSPTTRAWCWLGLVLFLLALGPVITVFSVKLPVPGPFVIWSEIPGLNMVRVPARFIGPFSLVLGLASAGWIHGLGKQWRQGIRRFILLWVLPAIMVIETLIIPVPVTGQQYDHPALHRLPELYTAYTGDPEPPDLVVNFPLIPPRTQFLYQQTIHGLPTVDGALSNEPPAAMNYFRSFNWAPDYLREMGVDIVIYQSWAARSVYGERFYVPEETTGSGAEYAGQYVEPLVFFREVMNYGIAYEDDELILFIP
jgi:hypothetical protein